MENRHYHNYNYYCHSAKNIYKYYEVITKTKSKSKYYAKINKNEKYINV